MTGIRRQYCYTRAAWVAIVSDTHGFIDPRVADVVRHCDLVVHAGDIGCAQVLSALRPRHKAVLAVCGNNDTARKWPVRDRAVLAALPNDLAIDLPGGRLVVIHGHQIAAAARRHARLRNRYAEARAIAYGHSHRLVCDYEHDPWVLNPGAAGRSRTFGGPSCLLLHARKTLWDIEVVRLPAMRRQRRCHG
ncbi:MAG: metallophosphoesterase family protein [Acidiferrobacterales bacterium]